MSFAEDRLNICNSCSFNIDKTCMLCGCNIEDKVKKKEESCPHVPKFWGAYTEEKQYKQPKQLKITEGSHNNESPPNNDVCIPCKNRH